MSVDPTRVVQVIVTGIGFLGAGVIVKEGFSISGLNTAASIWASSAIGVMVGVGFYVAAILLGGVVRAVYVPAIRPGTLAPIAKRSRDCSALRKKRFTA